MKNGKKPKAAYLEKARKWPMFVIVYNDGSRKKFSKHLTWDVAQQKLTEIQNRIGLGTFDLADYTQVREKTRQIAAAAVEYIAERERQVGLGDYSLESMKKDQSTLLLFIEKIGKKTGVAQITKADMEDFVLWLKNERMTQHGKPFADASIRGYLKTMSVFFNWCIDKGYLRENPLKGFFRKKSRWGKDDTPRYATHEEVEKIREELAKGPAWRLDAFNFGLWTGARASEILRVKRDDIYKRIYNDKISVVVRILGKGNKERFVPIGEECRALIERRLSWLETDAEINVVASRAKHRENAKKYKERWKAGFIFYDVMSKYSLSEAIREARRRAGVADNIKFHSARHTYATEMLGQGIPLAVVSKLMGHSETRTTEGYAKIVDTVLLEHAQAAKEI